MDDLDIEAIEARLRAATPGGFRRAEAWDDVPPPHDSPVVLVPVVAGWEPRQVHAFSHEDADFIIAAPEDIRALLAAVRRLTEERDGWRRAEMARRPHQLRAHRLLSGDSGDSALPADIRERVIPGSYMLATLMDLLEIVAKERDAARRERDAARNALAAVEGGPETGAEGRTAADRAALAAGFALVTDGTLVLPALGVSTQPASSGASTSGDDHR